MNSKAETRVGLHHAKTHLSELLRRVEAGEEVVILRRGKAVARLVRSREEGSARPLGAMRGQWTLPPAEDLIGSDPDVERLFYGDDG